MQHERCCEGIYEDVWSMILAVLLGTMAYSVISPELIEAERRSSSELIAVDRSEIVKGSMGVDMSVFKEKQGDEQ